MPASVLTGFGRRLRSTAGGIGAVASEADDEFAASFEVKELDMFLSHSWQATWWLKYLVLLLYFNIRPALIVSVAVGLACFAAQRRAVTVTSFTECREEREVFATTVYLGIAAFLAALLSWHHIIVAVEPTCVRLVGRSIVRMFLCMRAKTIFLDKVCIHQTNPRLKAKGIESIGAILGHSRTVLVAWDTTYFTRLWCTYELSAFQFARPEGQIVILPIELGGFVTAAYVITCSSVFTWSAFSQMYQEELEFAHAMVIYAVFAIPLLLTMRRVRTYLQDLAALGQQLEDFSVRRACCYCCDSGHVHPVTGEPMMCDRKLVYASIAHWHGGGNQEVGLDAFDAKVRKSLRADITKKLGRWGRMPYLHAVSVSLPPFLQKLGSQTRCPLESSLTAAFSEMLLGCPLCLAMLTNIARLGASKRETRCGELSVELVLVFSCMAAKRVFSIISEYFLWQTRELWGRAAFVMVESLLVWWIYFRSKREYLAGGDSVPEEDAAVELSAVPAAQSGAAPGAEQASGAPPSSPGDGGRAASSAPHTV